MAAPTNPPEGGDAVLRDLGPNETRCTLRHALGLYGNIVAGAVYHVPRPVDPGVLATYAVPLAECVARHPALSAGVKRKYEGKGKGGLVFVQKDGVDLRRHFRRIALLPAQGEGWLERVLEELAGGERYAFDRVGDGDRDGVVEPPWSLDVLPLEAGVGGTRVFVAFTYSHGLGDGMSGLALHRTFHAAWQEALRHHQRSLGSQAAEAEASVVVVDFQVPAPRHLALPPQADTPASMPVTWTFLLSPLLGSLLPAAVTRWLGIQAEVSGADAGTRTGAPMFRSQSQSNSQSTTATPTSVQVVRFDAPTAQALLGVCRTRGAKITALLDFLIAAAVRRSLDAVRGQLSTTTRGPRTKLVATVPVNLRRGLGVAADAVGNYGGGAYLQYNIQPGGEGGSISDLDEEEWQTVRDHGRHLARVATDLRNQPVGLLRYVADVGGWLQGKIGGARDCSWELSNLGSFQVDSGGDGDGDGGVEVQQLMWSQPASAVGTPLSFNAVGLKDAGLVVCVSWQVGALGTWEEGDDAGDPGFQERKDRTFVRGIADELVDRVAVVSGVPSGSLKSRSSA